jgi:hypothetical protein
MLANMITIVCTVDELRFNRRERYGQHILLTSSVDNVGIIEQPISFKFYKQIINEFVEGLERSKSLAIKMVIIGHVSIVLFGKCTDPACTRRLIREDIQ